MKLILIKDIKGTGKAGDLVAVADGYGKNYLLKNGLAKTATNEAINENQQQKNANAFHKEQERLRAVELGKVIEKTKLVIPIKCGKNGKIFGAINTKEIAEQFEKQGITIDKRKIELKEPLKTIGRFNVTIKLHPTVTAKFILELIAE